MTTIILCAVSAAIFLMYALFAIPETALSMTGCVRLSRINAKDSIAYEKKGETAL